ncbi:hypothetical protein [Gloeocapsa sp. PCC 73106]|uniref:hypothetical protein n=1 Tax=Gloeocapsa sp. PCC 73106 TaxID=102232 RepID=UPI0002AC361C|nr:hypothetical protein [Gloeocapsa sp. PCC 73106]ELR98529.1 hypothetical protein GLO73106DRAFT_00023630 [Gloeocapsa sp. PCC 73106]
MKEIGSLCSRVMVLGTLTTLTSVVLATQAQARVDGADIVLENCANQGIVFLEKCDPNADVAVDASNLPNNMPGLNGSFNIRPLGTSAGLALEGTGLTDEAGNPLTNIDFSIPSQVRSLANETLVLNSESDPVSIGRFDILSSTGDFRELLGWSGSIKDLQVEDVGGFIGEPIPGTVENPRIRDFIVIDGPGEFGTGIIDGLSYGGVALDLVSLSSPSFDPVADDNLLTSMSFQMELQAYKLDEQGNRLEEHELLPGGSTIYTNQVDARLSAAFAFSPEDLVTQLDEVGELLAWYGYDITFDSIPNTLIFVPDGPDPESGVEPIPEPTSIISSLLLFGGGVLKLAKGDRF